MKKVWIYEIVYYTEDDEYGHHDLVYLETFVFENKESAERWKKDWETKENLKSMSGKGNLYSWYYGGYGDRFESSIKEKEIMNY